MGDLLTGINIQFPISQLILSGKKLIETRTYPLPERLKNQQLAFIETPGGSGKFKSRVVGIIIFSDSFRYKSAEDFYADQRNHCVTEGSKWAWNDGTGKWGWRIKKVIAFEVPVPLNKRGGIIYTKNVRVSL